MLGEGLRIEEETSTSQGLFQEIGGEGGDPFEEGETSAALEHKQSDGLLDEQADDDGGPGNELAVLRR